jgi:hypothetical protein
VVVVLVAAGLTCWMVWAGDEARKRAEAERQEVQRAEELVARMHAPDEEKRRFALRGMLDAIGRNGPDSAAFRIGVPALVDYIVTGQPGAFVPGYPVQALEALAEQYRHEVIPLVAGRLSDKDATVRRTTVQTLCKRCALHKPAKGGRSAPRSWWRRWRTMTSSKPSLTTLSVIRAPTAARPRCRTW